jgi:hypothetical protein
MVTRICAVCLFACCLATANADVQITRLALAVFLGFELSRLTACFDGPSNKRG